MQRNVLHQVFLSGTDENKNNNTLVLNEPDGTKIQMVTTFSTIKV